MKWSGRQLMVGVCVAALGFAVVNLVVRAPDSVDSAADQTAITRELVTLANRGARTSWLVTFAFTRVTAAGGRLHQTVVSAHRAPGGRPLLDVDEGLGTLVATTGSRTYTCTIVKDGPQCLTHATTGITNRPGAVYGGAVVSGRYSVARAPGATIAGLPARCFDLTLQRGNPVPGLGFRSQQCYSPAGVPLRSRVQTAAATDQRVALTVRRAVGRSDLTPLLAPYGLARLAPER